MRVNFFMKQRRVDGRVASAPRPTRQPEGRNPSLVDRNFNDATHRVVRLPRLTKKAQVETQFNWMFVLIAGGVILLVAFTFISKQRNAANLEIADTLLRQLDEITTSAGITKGTAQIVDLPRVNVALSCTEECTCTINVLDVASKGFEDKILFGPKEITADLMLWAQEWSVPFRVTNFVYVSSPSITYYIVGEDTDALYTYVKEKLPSLLNAHFVTSMAGVEHPGSDMVRIAYVNQEGDCSGLDSSFINEDFSCVLIRSDGRYTFFTKSTPRSSFTSNTVYGIGDAAYFGALFASDSTMFQCNIYKGLARLEYVANIYRERSEYLDRYRDSDGNTLCDESYTSMNALSALDGMMSQINRIATEPQAISGLNVYVEQLKSANHRILQLSCPDIY